MADEVLDLPRALADVVHLAQAVLEGARVDLHRHARLLHLREAHQVVGAERAQLRELRLVEARRRRAVLRGAALQLPHEMGEEEQAQLLVADLDHGSFPLVTGTAAAAGPRV